MDAVKTNHGFFSSFITISLWACTGNDTNSEFMLSLERFFRTGRIELPSSHPANQGNVNAINCVSFYEGMFIGAFSANMGMASPPVKTSPSLIEALNKFTLAEKAMHEREHMCAPHFDIASYWFMASFGYTTALNAGIVMALKNGNFPLPISGANPRDDAVSCATFATGKCLLLVLEYNGVLFMSLKRWPW